MAGPYQQQLEIFVTPAANAAGINGTVTGTTDLFTNPSTALPFVTLRLIFVQVAATNVLTPVNISIGYEAANYENIKANAAVPLLTAGQFAYIDAPLNIAFAKLPENTTLKVNVRTAATVSVGGSYTFRIEVVGFYEPAS